MSESLRRTLNLRDLTLIAIGTVIGSGIFLVPAVVMRYTGGHVGLSLLVWVVAGVLSLLGALTYGELGAAHPEAGGLYAYIRNAFGPLPAFMYGWAMFTVISSGSCATLAVAFAGYLGQLVPLSPLASKAIAVLMIAVVAVVNVRGTRQSSDLQNWTTGIKVVAIVGVSLLLLVFGRGGDPATPPVSAWPATLTPQLLSGVGLAMIAVLWAYEGWQYVTFSAGETQDVQRTFPRAIVIGTGALIVIYVLANLGYNAALGPAGVAGAERVAADAVGTTFGATAGKAISVVILIAIFSAANGLTLTAPRLYYAMARDRVFFAKLAEVHPRFGTPAIAIIASSVWAAALALSGTFEQLLTYVVFAGWIFYGLGALAVFQDRRQRPNGPRPFKVPGYPVTPILFVASAASIVINTIVSQPARATLGLAAVALGAPIFYLWRMRNKGQGAADDAGGERA